MPKGLSNWKYKDVTKFLKDHGFSFYKQKEGSHEAWIDQNGQVVEVNYTKGSYPERTLETMIRQSGIPKKDWRKWAERGGR